MKLELLAPVNSEVKLPPAALIEITEGEDDLLIDCSGPGHFEAESIVGGARTKLIKELEREPTAQELVAELTSGKHGPRLRKI